MIELKDLSEDSLLFRQMTRDEALNEAQKRLREWNLIPLPENEFNRWVSSIQFGYFYFPNTWSGLHFERVKNL